jgi:hypothetical protein
MSYSKGHNVNCNRVTLGGIFSDDSDTIDIVHSDPNKKILVNGVEPSAGGGGGVTDPLNLNRINAAVAMTTPSIAPPASGGGLVIKANDLQPPAGAGETLNITATTVGTVNGNISTMNGNLQVQGTGAITCGTTITATGDINTQGTGDIVSGRNIYFDGVDVYKRTLDGGVPNDTSYVIFKQLAVKSEANTFTAVNTFADNIVMSGTGKSFNNLGGTVSSNTANISTGITCGTITCDNGGTNECKARAFNTRTSGTNGWTITQALEEANAPGNKANNILQFAATQAQAAGIPTQIYVTASDFDPSQGDEPSVIIDPATTESGGRVQASQFITGTTASRFVLKQDVGGPLDNHLQINASDASSEVRFRDNGGQSVLRVGKTAVTLGNTIPLNFGLYSFHPQQYTYAFTNAGIDDNPAVLFNSSSNIFTNVNTGATSVSLATAGEAFYKLTITAGASSGGTYGPFRFCVDFPYTQPAFAAGTVIMHYDGTFSGGKYPSGTTIPRICGFSFGGTDFKLCWPGIVSGTETYNGTLTLTKMPY